jgi:hypothetical protein
MADGTGPTLTQEKKEEEDCLTKLSAVPVKPAAESLDDKPARERKRLGRKRSERRKRPKLCAASFEFGTDEREQKLREKSLSSKPKHALSQSSELAPYAAEIERKEEKRRQKAGAKVVETEDIVLGKPGRTILDRLMSFVAKQLKKIEQMFLKALGAAPEPEEQREKTEEEEEALELMTLREQAARAAYLAARKKYREEEEERLEAERIQKSARQEETPQDGIPRDPLTGNPITTDSTKIGNG